LLEQAGIVPDIVCPASIDENVRKAESPGGHALRLAREKAHVIAESRGGDGGFVLAADTVVACGARILPKPSTEDEVRRCVSMLSGRRHRVTTAVALAHSGLLRTRVVETRVAFRRLSHSEIDSYAQSGEGIGKAGGYAIQGRAETFVKSLSGSYSNVVGLPLTETVMLLRGYGFPC
jgi:septum formation protein